MSSRETSGSPSGLPHSLQGVGPDGAEFVIVFDDGSQSESNTFLITDWFAHTPPDVLPEETLAKFPRGAQGIVPLP